jgi:ABC-type multidrug transport system fused ATPase/permease subunit
LKKVAKNILLILTHHEKKWLLLITIADILINILDILFLAALILIINYFTQQNYLSTHFDFLTTMLGTQSYLFIIAFFLLFTLKNFLGFTILRRQHHFVYEVALRIAQTSLSDYLSSDYHNYAHIDSSVHIRKISQQSIQFGQYVLLNLQQIISQVFLIVIAITAILFFNARLFLLLLLIIIPPVLLTAFLMKKKLQALRFQAKINSEKSIQYLYEALNGYVESNVFDKNAFFTKRFQFFQKKMNFHIADQQTIQGFPSRLIEIFAIMGLCFLIIINKQYANPGLLPVLLIGAFMGAAYKIIPGIVKILNSAGQIKAYHFTITDLLQHNYKPIAPDKEKESKIDSITFENVSFKYGERPVLEDLSLTIDTGDFLGICGASGKGKTTIINLLLGFLEQSTGMIKINGRLVPKLERRSFMKDISYAKQQPFFIHDTILKNILLDDASYDAERLIEIISVTGVKEIIELHSEGLQYVIEENGKNISGGERQRIVFARILYKLSDLIILDESFTELDEVSETQMLRHLHRLAGLGKMVILITHNKNSFGYCNKIISLNE